MKYWADVIPEICKWMTADNSDAFELTVTNTPSVFMDEETAKQHAHYENFYQPAPGIFVRVLQSARSTLETVRTILTSYDEIAGTDTLQSFAFTLQ